MMCLSRISSENDGEAIKPGKARKQERLHAQQNGKRSSSGEQRLVINHVKLHVHALTLHVCRPHNTHIIAAYASLVLDGR
jgi:hypothetical protein